MREDGIRRQRRLVEVLELERTSMEEPHLDDCLATRQDPRIRGRKLSKLVCRRSEKESDEKVARWESKDRKSVRALMDKARLCLAATSTQNLPGQSCRTTFPT
jgi:hypothetical protein